MHQSRRGLTLIEVAVAILIVLMAIALLVPATRTPREASRRSQCKNNLKQIGLALHNYHDNRNSFPPGWISSTSFGWSALLLPYVEQAQLYRKLNFAAEWTADSANPRTVLPVFRCPLETGANIVGAPVLSVPAGRGNYPGVSGATLISNQPIDVKQSQGLFGQDGARTIREISDGTSNTLFVGERKSSGGPKRNPGGDTIWIGVRDNHSQQGQALAVGDCNSANPLNFKAVAKSAAPSANISGFSSLHSGGAHFLLGDGSVRFISDNINPITYANLATIDDGAVLGDF